MTESPHLVLGAGLKGQARVTVIDKGNDYGFVPSAPPPPGMAKHGTGFSEPCLAAMPFKVPGVQRGFR